MLILQMVSKALQRQAQEIGEIEVGWGNLCVGGKMILCKHWNEQKKRKEIRTSYVNMNMEALQIWLAIFYFHHCILFAYKVALH